MVQGTHKSESLLKKLTEAQDRLSKIPDIEKTINDFSAFVDEFEKAPNNNSARLQILMKYNMTISQNVEITKQKVKKLSKVIGDEKANYIQEKLKQLPDSEKSIEIFYKYLKKIEEHPSNFPFEFCIQDEDGKLVEIYLKHSLFEKMG
jgi:predicted RND superfamily exporter protein